MRGGFEILVHPACRVSEVDLEATKLERERLHEQLRLRNHLLDLLSSAPVDEDLVRVTPFEVIDGEPSEIDREAG